MDKDTIQRFASFDEKIKIIIPRIYNKSFVADFNEKYEFINKLKGLRNSVIHTKNFSKNWAASYRDIYRNFISLDYNNAYNNIIDYITFYKPDWIEEYDSENC